MTRPLWRVFFYRKTMNLIEWGAVVFNVLYVVLAARRHIACWPAGIVGVVLSFVVYCSARLYSDATLQVCYLGLSIYGWWQWSKGKEEENRFIRRMDFQCHFRILMLGLVSGLVMGWFWSLFNAALPFIDGLTTSFGLLTTWLVAKRYLENWIYWIVIDLVCVGVYINREIDAFVYLFLLYAILAVWGWKRWRNDLDKQREMDAFGLDADSL